MIAFHITLWSQEENRVIRHLFCEGSRDEVERILSDFWNNSRAVVAEAGRFRARLYEVGNSSALSTIG